MHVILGEPARESGRGAVGLQPDDRLVDRAEFVAWVRSSQEPLVTTEDPDAGVAALMKEFDVVPVAPALSRR